MACFFRKNLISFIKNNTVMCIALLAAIITSFIVPIDREYSGYFDYKTLTCLFCVLAVVCALKNIGFFYILAKKSNTNIQDDTQQRFSIGIHYLHRFHVYSQRHGSPDISSARIFRVINSK